MLGGETRAATRGRFLSLTSPSRTSGSRCSRRGSSTAGRSPSTRTGNGFHYFLYAMTAGGVTFMQESDTEDFLGNIAL
ncbi:unnamed protein product [Arctogadus glacialis]